jgi:hypothetical protein
MQEKIDQGSDIFWEVVGSSADILLLNGIEVILTIATLIFFVIAGVRLYRSTNIAGSRHIRIALAGYVIGFLVYSAYLALVEDEGNQTIDALFGVYVSLCITVGTYGFLLLCNSLPSEKANTHLPR